VVLTLLRLGAPLLIVVGGVLVSYSTPAAVALAALGCAAALALFPLDLVIAVVVVTAFTSRLSMSIVADFELRPEHAATVVLAAALVRRGQLGELTNQLLRPPAGWLGAYVAYAAAVSFARLEEITPSIGILGFLCLDWLLFASLLTVRLPRALIYDVIAWCASISAVIAMATWVYAEATGGSFAVARGLDNPAPAAYALAYEPNVLAGILVLSVIALTCGPRGPRRRTHVLAAGLAILAIPATQTRAAVAALAVAFLIVGVQRRAGAIRRALVRITAGATVVLVAAVTAGAFDPGPLLNKFRAIADLQSGNGAYRLNLYKLAMNDLDSAGDWVFGLGVNSFSLMHLDPSRPGSGIPAYLSNLPLQIVHDTGLVGVLLIGALVAQLWWRARHSVAALPMLTAFFIISLSTSPFWFASTWLFAGLAASRVQVRRRSTGPGTGTTAGQSLPLVDAR
jgi:hypothetical protein